MRRADVRQTAAACIGADAVVPHGDRVLVDAVFSDVSGCCDDDWPSDEDIRAVFRWLGDRGRLVLRGALCRALGGKRYQRHGLRGAGHAAQQSPAQGRQQNARGEHLGLLTGQEG